ncbi:MAG: DUF7452 domain-containing protein [Rubrobacter sp.]
MRLRGLTPLLRYAVYAVGAVLVFLAAVGLGAAASLVIGWQSERTQVGFGGFATPEDTSAETTGRFSAGAGGTTSPEMTEATAVETTRDTGNADSGGAETAFVHDATDANSRGDYTYISDPAIDGDPDAVVLVEQPPAEATYDHNVGVWFDSVGRQRWAIFNQDRAAVPSGSTFRVILPPSSDSFVHRAGLVNTVNNITYLDDPLTNGEPDAALSVTQNWNPGGGRGVYNDHPIRAFYDEDVQQWAIYNQDGAPMPDGAAFNVAVSGDDEGAR